MILDVNLSENRFSVDTNSMVDANTRPMQHSRLNRLER